MEQTLQTLEVRVDRLESEAALLSSKVNNAAVELATITEKLGNIIVTLADVKIAVSGIRSEPVKRWDTVVRAVITSAVSAMIGFLMAKYSR